MSTDPITTEQALVLLKMLEAAGLKPPEIYYQPRTKDSPAGALFMAKMWAASLNEWGVTFTEAQAATGAYVNEPDAGQYPKAWPDPGKVIARTPVGRKALSLGTDADCDRAWTECNRRLHILLSRMPDGPKEWQHIATDEGMGRAFLAGLKAMGGWSAWQMSNPADPWPIKAWKEGYRAERRRQAQAPAEVRAMLPGAAQRAIGVAS